VSLTLYRICHRCGDLLPGLLAVRQDRSTCLADHLLENDTDLSIRERFLPVSCQELLC
jgi:hypothetical protein